MNTIQPGQIYKHSKTGTLLRIVAIARQTETLKDLVVYEVLYNNPVSKFWARPLEMFADIVEIDGNQVPRYEYIEEGKHKK